MRKGDVLNSYDKAFQNIDPRFKKIVEEIPRLKQPRLPADWLHWQIMERFIILKQAEIQEGFNVLEIGCGPHEIATIPLAYMVGKKGRVVAVDIGRWKDFWKILEQTDLASRVIPLQEDARKLPFPFSCFDLAVCVHGIRSFDGKESILQAVKEMLRVAKKRIFIAESSPIAKNKAQEAHLAMYNLRHPIFKELGHPEYGDIPYLNPEELRTFAEEAGASRIDMKLIDVNLPHHLAYFPLETIMKIEDESVRDNLELKWRKALAMLDKHGEEHPPVITLSCHK